MTYLSQLSNSGNELTFTRKKEYIRFNFGPLIDNKLKQKNCSVLEIGPGLGEFISYCNDQGIQSVDVIDYEKEVLDYVSKKFKVRNKFMSADVFSIKEKLGSYDIIMMTQVLEHIPTEKHIPYLQTLYNHLNEGGVILVTVPNIGNPLAIYERYYEQLRRKNMVYPCFCTPQQLQLTTDQLAVITDAGATVEQQKQHARKQNA